MNAPKGSPTQHQKPAAEDLFADWKVDPPPKNKDAELHTIISKVLFACKHTRTYIYPNTALQCTCVQNPTSEYWKNMIRMFKYINSARKDKLVLSAENLLDI